MTDLWTQTLAIIEPQCTKTQFQNFSDTRADYNGNGLVTVFVPEQLQLERLEHHFHNRIQRELTAILQKEIEVSYQLAEPETPAEPLDEAETADDEDDDQPSEADLARLEFRPAYSEKHGQLVYTTYRTSDGSVVPNERILAPFTARIAEKLTIYSEDGQNVVYKIEGRKGKRRFAADVTADDWADPRMLVSALLRYLPGKPPETDPALRRHWGPAISALTSERDMHEVRATDCTGWTPDGKAFVMPDGSYGQGYLCMLGPGLDQEFAKFGLREAERAVNQRTAYLLIYGLAKIFRPAVVYPLLAHAFLPPLLRWTGDEARYLFHLHANTGSFKTELAKLIMALYGPTETRAITYKWSNTPYGAEHRAHALKDVLMLIDDLKPGTISETDTGKWVAFVQAAVDALGRKRATISGRASVALAPRALLLSTGEAVPEAGEASYTARMLLAELNRQPAGRNRLLDKIKSRAGQFSGLMYLYVAWLRDRQHSQILPTYKQLQTEVSLDQASHARLANNFASNRLGAVMFARFCRAHEFLSPVQCDDFLAAHLVGLHEIIQATADKAESERYSSRFIEALHDALAAGFATLSDQRSDNRVGWQTAEYVYLINGAKDVVDQWLRSSGQTAININKPELRRQLFDDGLSYCTTSRANSGKYDVQARDPMTGSYALVTAVHLESFFQYTAETGTPNQEIVHDLHDLHDLALETV